ncbi:hypothetical protein Trydic_g4285 [Trypoxylus dichotomus]
MCDMQTYVYVYKCRYIFGNIVVSNGNYFCIYFSLNSRFIPGCCGRWVGRFKLTLLIVPCNIPEVPRCLCERAPIISIQIDKDGYWCNGKEDKWACENVDDWSKYESECKNEVYCVPNSNKLS